MCGCGFAKWVDYFERVNPGAASRDLPKRRSVDVLVAAGAVIGTPDDAIAQIERLQAKQGDFG